MNLLENARIIRTLIYYALIQGIMPVDETLFLFHCDLDRICVSILTL